MTQPNIGSNGIIRPIAYSLKKTFNPKACKIILAVAIFHLILLPWEMRNRHVFDFFGMQNLDSVWGYFWSQNNYFSYAGATIACTVQHTLCTILNNTNQFIPLSLYKKLTFLTLISNPIQWYTIKAALFNQLWFGDDASFISWSILLKNQLPMLLEGALILIVGIVFTGIGILQRGFSTRKKLCQFVFFFVIFNFITFSLFHYEYRYSLFLQLIFIYLPLWFFFGFDDQKTEKP